MHDYECEARAKDVKLEDITSDVDNANILARLRDNDPGLKCMSITTDPEHEYDFDVREGDHLGWLGYFVGRYKHLEILHIDSIPENINLNAFLEGLGQNRSIQILHIYEDLGENFQNLVPFLRNNDSLRHLSFNSFDIGLQCARNVAILLGQSSSLNSLSFAEIVFDDEGLTQITAALRSQPQIEELSFSSYNVSKNGYVALGRALEGFVSLTRLELIAHENDFGEIGLIDDGVLHALVEGLKHCHNLTWLRLYGNLFLAEEVSRSLSTLFQSDNCRLKHLDLGGINIDDDGMAVLATGLASLPSLKQLDLRWGMSVGDQGLQSLVRGLVNCHLDKLDISGSMLMESVSGLRSLGSLVRRTTNMRSLSLCDGLTDEGLQSFVEGVANCCNLTELDLSRNHLITANGSESLSSLLRAECCSLCTLDLSGIHIRDDGAVVLANGLIGNKSLTTLRFIVSHITERGWAAFSRILCDTSSVNNTYLSNHKLEHIGGLRMSDNPQDILDVLKLNKSYNQAAAICKILHSHPDIDITPLFEFNLKCLPLAVEWFEKARPYYSLPRQCE